MPSLLLLKVGGIGVVLLVVGALLWTVRAELIEKGENIVKAQDNAALVKAQQEQTRKDAERIRSQQEFIAQLQAQGQQVQEKIRYVAAPCTKDGASDPRVGDVVDWLRSRGPADRVPAAGGGQPEVAVPSARLPASAR